MPKPASTDYPVFYESYIKLVNEDDVIETLRSSLEELVDFLESIAPDKSDYRYAEGKWTVKQLLQHVIDTERIFAYRALCFARHEKQSLPGFDEKMYSEHADVSMKTLKDLKEEMLIIRESTYMLFRGFTPEMLDCTGISNNNEVKVNAIGYMIIGHVRYHFSILRERYLS